MLIAIDGPAASGKGTIALKLANHYGLKYLDTGKLYRLVAYNFLATEPMPSLIDDYIIHKATAIAKDLDYRAIDKNLLEDERVGKCASILSAILPVREALHSFQIEFAKADAILDGRDIGTVILPEADFKFFITADVETRALRRFSQIKEKNLLQKNKESITYDQILRDLRMRDRQDTQRSVAPLTPARDAHIIDTTHLSIEDTVAKLVSIINSK
ncbi:MAG: (d)CMP kinase [Alphaproteobacteria bacterium]|jgi:cytidylate kinase